MAHIQAHLIFATGGMASSLPQVGLVIQTHIKPCAIDGRRTRSKRSFNKTNVTLTNAETNQPHQALVPSLLLKLCSRLSN